MEGRIKNYKILVDKYLEIIHAIVIENGINRSKDATLNFSENFHLTTF